MSVRYVKVHCYSPIYPSDRVGGEGDCEAMVEGYREGTLKDLESNISQCHLAHHKTAYPGSESKSGLRGVRPATNLLDRGRSQYLRLCFLSTYSVLFTGTYCGGRQRDSRLHFLPYVSQVANYVLNLV